MPKRIIYEGRKVRFAVVDVPLPGGKTAQCELVEHPGAVVVLPLFDDGKVLLEDHYRFAIGGNLIEAPAGTLDPGETPEACARRELEEETGLLAGEISHLGDFYSSPGVMTELMHAYLARKLERGAQRLEDDEMLETIEVPFDEALEWAASGRIKDGKTIATLFLAERFLHRREQGRGAPK